MENSSRTKKGPRTARELARDVILRCEREGSYLTLALSSALSHAHLSNEEAALATEIAYGTMRFQSRMDRAIAAYSPSGLPKDPIVLRTMRVAAYQILMMDSAPAHHAVSEAVDAVKELRGPKVSGYLNAVLRKIATTGEPRWPPDELAKRDDWADKAAVPRWIADELAQLLPETELHDAIFALSAHAPTSLRVTTKTTREKAIASILGDRPSALVEPSPLSPSAIVASKLNRLSEIAALRGGEVVVEDLGAQIVADLLGASPGEAVLDVCAGRGGKTLHLADLAGGKAALHACDIAPRKLEALTEAAARTDAKTIVTFAVDFRDHASIRTKLRKEYDAILVDAPCTGLGVLRRHPEAKWRLGPEDPARMAALASEILRNAAALVRKGGRLVFAVCSFTQAETTQQIERFLQQHKEFIRDDARPEHLAPLMNELGELRTFPHRDGADGFFAVRLRRL